MFQIEEVYAFRVKVLSFREVNGIRFFKSLMVWDFREVKGLNCFMLVAIRKVNKLKKSTFKGSRGHFRASELSRIKEMLKSSEECNVTRSFKAQEARRHVYYWIS